MSKSGWRCVWRFAMVGALVAGNSACGGGGGGGSGGGMGGAGGLPLASVPAVATADAAAGGGASAEAPAAESASAPPANPQADAGSADRAARRAAALQAWQQHRADFELPVSWTGDSATCAAGNVPDAVREAHGRVINYYRGLAGLPSVTRDADMDRKAQAGALMVRAQGTLSHSPTPDWKCYTAEGAEAAAHSNIAIGYAGTRALPAYMADRGHQDLGHRRWLLYSRLWRFGSGDTSNSNAIWVLDDQPAQPAASALQQGIAWPPRGYLPWTDRVAVPTGDWSFGLPGADFLGAQVEMRNDRGELLATLSRALEPGEGDETLAWNIASPEGAWSRAPADTRLTVRIRGVQVSGVARDFDYEVVFVTP